MLDDGGLDDAGPSDSWIASLIRVLRGWEPGTPVPAGLIASWRAHLRAEVRRHAAARAKGREPGLPSRGRTGTGGISAGELVMEMLASGEGQAAVALLAATPAILSRLVEAAAALSYKVILPGPRHEAAATYEYLRGKVGGRPWPRYWGREQPRVTWRDGRTARGVRPFDLGVPAAHRAAINAVTPGRAGEWQRRLDSGSGPEILAVLEEMDRAGREATGAAAPLPIWRAEPGPPRGLLHDTPAAPPAAAVPGDARGRG